MPTADEMDVTFDPLAEGFVDSPYEQYALLRDHDPVQHSPLLHGWVVTRFDDVGRLLRDPTVSSDIHNATPTPLTEMELERLAEQRRAARTLVLMDDPDHARIRKLLADPFRPREIDKLRVRITERVADTLDRLRDTCGDERVELDLIEEFAYPLPVEIFSEMLGVPDEDHPRFRHWTQLVARSVDPVMRADEREECLAGLEAMYAYLEEVADRKRAEPGDDLMSALVHAEVDGGRLTHEELMAQLVTLYMAGHEPTASLIGLGMVALLRTPDQLARLRDEPGLLRNGVSELLRYDGPNQFVRRVLTRDTPVAGVELPAGAVVYASPASANRDPRRWGDTADQVVVDRSDAGQHLQFGAGVHACLGSHLARLQAEIAFAALLERLEDVELAGTPEHSTRMFIRGMARLPVACTIRPRST
ncbi:MAG: cytochrome P450 [Acidimicrobiales bacterium]|nr:cytochrome P450 [Acidimicrobiales bacterium]